LAIESDSGEFDGHSFTTDSRTIDGLVISADCYLSNGDTFEFDWSRVNSYEKAEQPMMSNNRMIANDTNPTPLAMKPVPEVTELTAKCALCGEPCKPRNGEKFYSHCVGGCK